MFDAWHFLRGGGGPRHIAPATSGQVFEAQISDRREPPPGPVLGVEVFTAEAGDVAATVAHLAEATRLFLAGLEEH
jgi:hypothetical protein